MKNKYQSSQILEAINLKKTNGRKFGCTPLCEECITGGCALCKVCQGNFSPECEPCYKVTKPAGYPWTQACLDKEGQRCEICWSKEENNNTFLQ